MTKEQLKAAIADAIRNLETIAHNEVKHLECWTAGHNLAYVRRTLPTKDIMLTVLRAIEACAAEMMNRIHEEALTENEEYNRELAALQSLEYSAKRSYGLAKICSIRVYLYKAYMVEHKFSRLSYKMHIEPLFDLLEAIASDFAGRPMCGTEFEWYMLKDAYDEHFERYERSYSSEEESPAEVKAEAEAQPNVYEILFNLVGEEKFCQMFLKPETYKAWKTESEGVDPRCSGNIVKPQLSDMERFMIPKETSTTLNSMVTEILK